MFISTYRDTPTGKTRKMFTPFTQQPKPRIRSQLGWTIIKLRHLQNLPPGSTSKSPTVTNTYQCCMQAQSWQNICYKCLWYWIHVITVQKEHHQFPSNTSTSPTWILLANRHVDHWSYLYLLQITTRISDQQNLINCNQSDSTHSFY